MSDQVIATVFIHWTLQSSAPMKSSPILAVVPTTVGLIALAYQGFTYTTREKTVDLGPIQISADKEHTIPLPPIVGAVALAGGIFLLVVGRGKS
jgi:hypothetical protein